MKKWLAIILLLVESISGCSPLQSITPQNSEGRQWRSSQVRSLDFPEDANSPDMDMIAIYDRLTSGGFEIRIDLLEGSGVNSQITLLLDQVPGQLLPDQTGIESTNWDKAYKIHLSDGVNGSENIDGCNIEWNTNQAFEMVTLRYACIQELPRRYQVVISNSDNNTPVDMSPEISTASSPAPQSRLAMVFWDTLPAATPAQNLRRWDGAHTGPFGQRHGLKHLLEAVSQSEVHIFLLDFLNPESIHGAQQVAGLDLITQLARTGKITLAAGDESPTVASNMIINRSIEIAKEQDLPNPAVLFASISYDQLRKSRNHNSLVFAELPDRTHLFHYQDTTLIPLPAPLHERFDQTTILNRNGLTREAKISLIQAAISGEKTNVILWGGNLAESPWADNSIALAAFSWISAHPWIQVLDPQALQNQKAITIPSNQIFPCHDVLCTPVSALTLYREQLNSAYYPTDQQLIDQINNLTDPGIRKLARDATLKIMQPTKDSDSLMRQAQAFGKLGFLIAAAGWQKNPETIANCDQDINWDNKKECILADTTWFTIIEPESGQLVFALFNSDPDLLLISPVEYQTGWTQTNLPNSNISGLGVDEFFQTRFTPMISNNAITLTASNQHIRFQLLQDRIQISASGSMSGIMVVPLSLRNIDASNSICTRNSSGWQCDNKQVVLDSGKSDAVQFFSAYDSESLMKAPEDPDLAYPSGHFLPYPIHRANLSFTDKITLQMIVQ